MSNNPKQILSSDDEFKHCDECFCLDACSTRCAIAEYWQMNSDIARQRGETTEQLWEINE